MKKLDIFKLTLPNSVDTAIGIVIDVISKEVVEHTTFEKYLCYSQNRLFYYHHTITACNCVECTYDEHWAIGETIVDYTILPDYDELLDNWLEEDKMNHRMILIESTLGLTIEQEVAICEAIGKIVTPKEKHLHVTFDRHFADKELCDKYHLQFDTIDE